MQTDFEFISDLVLRILLVKLADVYMKDDLQYNIEQSFYMQFF